MSILPIEIAEQILLRLPARSLVRFKLVCKQWRSLISDAKFAKDHANCALLDVSDGFSKDFIHQGFDNSTNSVILKSVAFETLDSAIFELKFQPPSIPVIVGCCNGIWLLSLHNMDDALVLWNPLLPEKYNHKYLPESNFSAFYRSQFDGFGYCPSIDDYKVVRLRMKIKSGYYPRCYSEMKAEVYSLKTNSWRIIPGIPATNTSYNHMTNRKGIHIGGSIYWTVYDYAVMIAFDLITEKFKLIERPSLIDYEHRKSQIYMLQVRGCLGVYRSGYNYEDTEIWIRNEDENKKGGGYWTKVLSIPRKYSMYILVLSFLNNNEVLLNVFEGGLRKLVIYDSAFMTFRDIPFGIIERPIYHMLETLVSPVSF